MSNPSQPPRRIYLIGLMGAGKSTIGRNLAARLRCAYIDNDATIATLSGHSTLHLSRANDTTLHQWESRYVQHVCALTHAAVCGIPASAADRPADLDLMHRTGTLVYLRCDIDTLTERIRRDPPRPWLDGDITHVVTAMHRKRDPILRAATHHTIDATTAPDFILPELLRLVPMA